MHKKPRGAAWILALLLFSCLRCLSPMSGSGSSSETVIGKVVNSDGSPACSAVVTLYPADYDPLRDDAPARLATDTTDVAGAFSVTAPDSAAGYSIVATWPESGARSLVSGIVLTGDTTRTRDAVLSPPGTISIAAPEAADIVNGYLYVPGTGIAAFLSGGRKAHLNQVPAGTAVSVNYASRTSEEAPSVLAAGVTVVSGATTFIPFPEWRYFKKLRLNTTASGAAVSGNTLDFPVLVRLTANNFDFGQAAGGGSDIRFANSSGVSLPYEIERWDAGMRLAEVWVKVDTVFGNNSVQSIVMYWGNPLAAGQSNGAAVFDTANGFQGVWHLHEAGTALARDATGNNFDGTPSDTAPAGAPGAIGPCRAFNGASNGIRMNNTANGKLNYGENGTYTISAWVYADTLDNKYHIVAGKGNEQYFLGLKRSVPDTTMRWEFVEYHGGEGWHITEEWPAAGVWTHIVGIRDGNEQFFYVNGKLVDSSIFISASSASRSTENDFTIGRHVSVPEYTFEEKCPFLGKIDEVRISNAANGADWIKLCFMNQKEQDALVKFE